MLIPKEVLQIANACSNDATRYILKGVHFVANGEKAKATATDGKVLLEAEFPLADEKKFPDVPGEPPPSDIKSGIILGESLLDASRSIPGKKLFSSLQMARCIFGDNTATLVTTSLERGNILPGRTIDGNFPNTESCIPKPEDIKFAVCYRIDVLEKLLTTLKRMGVESVDFGFTKDATGAARIDAQNGDIKIHGAIMPNRKM